MTSHKVIEELNQLFRIPNIDAALNLARQHIKNGDNDIELFVMLSRCQRAKEQFKDSEKTLNKAINLHPESPLLYGEMGVTYFHLGEKEKSLEVMNKAQALDPQNPYRYSSRAYIRGQMGDIDGAISDYEKAVEIDPKDDVAYNNLGLLLENKGEMEKAKNYFRKSEDAFEGKTNTAPPAKENEGVETTNTPSPDTPPGTHIEEEQQDKKQKLTAKLYFQSMKGVFTNKEERKRFFGFISGKKKK